ncbi:MAG: tetratricopeptide repeat protein, partial [Chloroflexi bacterium]
MQNETKVSCEHPEGALYDPAIPALPLGELIGREQELAHMKQQLQSRGNTALTLHGLPGVGKTSLAIALAHDPEIRHAFADGILWAGVGPHPNLLSHLSRWAGLLGISATQMAALRGIDEWAFAIRNAIGTRKMLLIIDDIWQYEEVQTLRVGAQNCAYLITTRSRDVAGQLALDGTMLIEELNAEQSVQLLNQVAQEVVSQETQKVQALVQAVGGLPLALTLLGNYLRKQASHGRISTTLERLGDAQERFQISEPQVPIESHPSLPDGTSLSLQSVIAVTDQLLPETARAAFYKLAVFPPKPNNFSEEAALAVTGSTFEELDILSDAGLVESYGDRCTLHQVIADYARIHLHDTKVEECEAYSRLIAYIADFVEAHRRDYELLDQENNTIHLVLTQAHVLGKQAELVRVVSAFAPFLILRGRYEEAERHLKLANQAAQALNDNDGITTTLLYLGEIEQCLGNYAQAESSLQEGLALARQMNNNERVCALLTQLGIVSQHQGNFQRAETVYQEGLMLARNVADHDSICILLSNLGWVSQKRGTFSESERYLQEGLALAHKVENREHVGKLLTMLGTLENRRGNFVQAQSYLQKGLTIARQLGDLEQVCDLLIDLGVALGQQ